MGRGQRRFVRRPPFINYRKRFVVATEGRKTEPDYFALFNSKTTTVDVKILKGKHRTAPAQVFARAEQFEINEGIRKGDEIWLVIDTDNWNHQQLNEVLQACRQQDYSLTVSNPCFEYWLLLHFENGRGVTSAGNCVTRLKRYLPDFDKGHVETHKLKSRIFEAIDRARQKDQPPCVDWPRTNGTTVYRLVDRLQDTVEG